MWYERGCERNMRKNCHSIHLNFREFYHKGLRSDITLKKEYTCSKCGEQIVLTDYDKMLKRSNHITGLIMGVSLLVLFNIDDVITPDLIKSLFDGFDLSELFIRVLTSIFRFVLFVIPTLVIDWLLIWLDRVRQLKKYCSKIEDCPAMIERSK